MKSASQIVAEALLVMRALKRSKIAQILIEENCLRVSDARGAPYVQAVGCYTRADAAIIRKGLLAGGIEKVTGNIQADVEHIRAVNMARAKANKVVGEASPPKYDRNGRRIP